MRAAIVLVMLALSVAGCADDDKPSGADDGTGGGGGDGTGPGTGGGTGGGGGPGNGTGSGQGGNGPGAGGPQTWYLHAEGECGSATYFMDLEDTSGDVDGCGSVGVGTTLFTFEGRETAAAGSRVEGTTHVVSEGPSYVEVWHVLLADGTQVGESEIFQGAITGLGYAPIEWSFDADVPAEATLTLEVHAFNAPSVFLGTEGDHASAFTLS